MLKRTSRSGPGTLTEHDLASWDGGSSAAAATEPHPKHTGRREFLASSGALLFAASSPLFAQSSSIVAVRVWPAKDYTRVTLELEAPLKFTHQVIRNPDRLVVDIDDLELSSKLRELVAKVNAALPRLRERQNRTKGNA